MKRLTSQILFAAAALAAVAVNATAQTIMKAEIPFSFQAGSYVLAPGAYEVKMPSGTHQVIMQNTDTGKSVILVTASDVIPPAKWARDGKSRLRFDCAGGRCVLRQVWAGGASRGADVPGPKLDRFEAVTAREITLAKASTK